MSSSEASNALISPSVCVCGLPLDMLSVQVQATTGNVYYLRVAHSDTIDYIRRIIAKKTKLSKERILLLYKDRQLREGSLEEHNVRDGSKLHLVPSVETGLLSQRPEQSVMQALESLNDGQVTDFLSGKAPLNLTMRLGDHMMLIQLQLSTVSPVQHHSSSNNSSSSSSRGSSNHFTTLRRGYSSSSSHSSSASSCTSVQTQHNNSSQSQQQNHQASPQKSILSTPPTSTSSSSAQSSRHSASRHHQHHHHHHHHHHHRNASSNGTSGGAARHHHHHHGHHYHHSHPYYHNPYSQFQLLPQPHSTNSAVLQSKSTTQSQPINLQQQLQQQQQHHQKTSPPAHQNPSAISSSKNSNVLVTSSHNSSTVSSHPIYSTPPRRSSSANNYSSSNFSSPASSLSSLSPTSPTNPWSPASFTPPPPTSSLHSSNYYSNNSSNIAYTPTSSSFANQHPQQHMTGKSSNSATSELPIRVCPHTSVDDLDLSDLGLRSSSMGEDLSFSTRRPMAPSSVGGRVRGVSAVGLDTRALAEASRNLTQTLRQLSSEVLTNKPSAGGHQGASVAAPHKKQTASCIYSGGQRNNGASNAAPVHDVEPSKPISPIAPESSNLSMASENSSLKAFKSSRSSRTASSVRPNGTNSDKPVRSTTRDGSGAAVSGTGVAGGESPAATHSLDDAKRGTSCTPPHQPQGAIIESMQHHGKGVFSGTFSGTLNPALQDRQGRPKRDISTIIHILNDLLCATPHYTNTAAAVAAVAAATSSKSAAPTSAASASPPRSPTGEPKESVSAEDAATRSRVQHIQAMLEQRAERRRARRLARTAGSGQPYSLPGANLPKSKHQQSSSKPETQPTKNSTLKCSSSEVSFVSGKKPLSEVASVLYANGIESKIDASANSDMVANSDASLSSKQQQQQQQQQHHQHQHLMRELLKGCVAASTDSSSARQLNSSGSPQNFPDCESECKQQLENNYSGAAHLQQQQIHHSGDVATLAVPTESPTAMEVADVQVESQTAESSSMDVDTTLESTTEIDSNQAPADEEHVPLKLPQDPQQQQDSVQQRSQQPQQDQPPQQPQQQKQQSSQQQEASGDAEQQDTAKIVSLNSGTVMA